MADERSAEDLSAETVAFSRPPGQDEPDRDHYDARINTTRFVALIALVGLVSWIGSIVLRPDLQADWTVAAIAFLFAVASALFPLQFAFKQEISFEVFVLVLSAITLPAHVAISVCVGGYIVGYAIRYRFSFTLDCPFNAGIFALDLGAIGLVYSILSIGPPVDAQPVSETMVSAAIAALFSILLTRFLVAVVITIESRQPLRQVIRDSTLGMQTAEQAMLGAMIALAIMGGLLVQISPWALLLLAVPAFALWLALRQNVATRHRIEASLATAQKVARIGSLDWDIRNGDIRWSEILYDILGYQSGEVQPSLEAYLARVYPDDRDRVQAAFAAAGAGNPVEIDHRIRLPTGEERSFNLKFNGVTDRAGRVRRTVGTIHDVTERKLLEDRLQFQAYHDSLTALPNRAFFMRKLESSFARYSRTGSIALLFLDLDRFKVVNDTMGHESGDHLLKVVARRLENCVRPNDVVARLGGDEFIILLDAVESDSDIVVVAQRIIAAITRPVDLPGQKAVTVSTSIGIVRPTSFHTTSDELLRDADTALYRAKDEGRNRFAFFDAAMGAATIERLQLEADLAGAVDRAELSLVYQPRINLQTGRVHMIESLVRWNHPTRGAISPAVFIPIAEEAGMIDRIGRWIVQTTIAEARSWFAVLNPSPTVSLNITRKQMLDEGMPGAISELIQQAGLRNAQFRIEIPEKALARDDETSRASVARLRATGFGISIDDFGTGHSSLASLRTYPIDMLQLDRQFVVELGTSQDARTVTQAVIGLAHGLELTVLAEGIEREEQVQLLRDLGCELGQGIFFCPPVPAAEMLTFLLRDQQNAIRASASGEPPNLRQFQR